MICLPDLEICVGGAFHALFCFFIMQKIDAFEEGFIFRIMI